LFSFFLLLFYIYLNFYRLDTSLVSKPCLALDRHRDLANTNNFLGKYTIKTLENLFEHLESLIKTQNLLFNKVQILENKFTDILELVRSKDQQIHFSTNDISTITTQLSKLSLGKNPNQSSNKFVLAKPRK